MRCMTPHRVPREAEKTGGAKCDRIDTAGTGTEAKQSKAMMRRV